LLKKYKGPDDLYGSEGLIKQLSKALIERAMQAELTEQIGFLVAPAGYPKHKTKGTYLFLIILL
jgi:transposase-like protein